MEKIRGFLKRKNVVFSAKRYFIDGMSAMAQGLFCTLLVGTILNTIGQQFHIGFLNAIIVTIGKGEGAMNYTIGGLCSAMVGPAMAVAIGSALQAPPLVLYSLIGEVLPPTIWAEPADLWPCSSWPSSPPRSVSWSAKRPRSTSW